MSAELLPCPFCGSSDVESMAGEFGNTWRVYCASCGGEMYLADRAQSLAAWNRRPEATERPAAEALAAAFARHKLTAKECPGDSEVVLYSSALRLLAHPPALQVAAPTVSVERLTDAQIIDIRDVHLPSQGEAFDCLAFARGIERATRNAALQVATVSAEELRGRMEACMRTLEGYHFVQCMERPKQPNCSCNLRLIKSSIMTNFEQLAATLATAEQELDDVTVALTGDEGDDPSMRVLHRLAASLGGKTVNQIIDERDAAEQERDKAVAVVTELVACKTLKGQWERSMSRDGDEMSATIALKEEYKRRQYLAWDAARSLVHPQETA